jgi:hypothetical protein
VWWRLWWLAVMMSCPSSLYLAQSIDIHQYHPYMSYMGKIDDIDKQEKTRTSIYITEANRKRLAKVPRGQKTKLINKALDKVLSELERKAAMAEFIERAKTTKKVKSTRSSEDMIYELRTTGTIKRDDAL